MTTDFNIQLFEDESHQNGVRYWLAREFMNRLGYESWASFKNIINKSMVSCSQLGIKINESFIETEEELNGKKVESFKLTRFACFLITMNADSKKPQVAKAKIVFAAIADIAVENDAISRLEVRNDLSQFETIMSSVAKGAGLESHQFGLFKDAGFRGMYNMPLSRLKMHKNMPDKGVLYDFMGLTELAGNLFRVTQTAAKIKSDNARGVNDISGIAKSVGKDVRDMMIKNSGVAPENLLLEDNIKDVKKELKRTNRQMKKIDKKK